MKEYPETKKFEMIYSSDSEGNWFEEVYYDPTVGKFENGEFTPVEVKSANAICVN